MSKKQATLQEETLQGAAPAQEQETVAQDPGADETGNAGEDADPGVSDIQPEAERPPLHLIVCAYPGTEDLVKKIWEKFYDLPVQIMTFQEGESLIDILETAMVMPELDKVFAVIPANLVPCAPVRWSELQIPRVDDQGNGKISFWGRVPVCFNKDVLVDFLPYNDGVSGEEFVKRYVTGMMRPELVSHSYGNYYTKVLRANPCESVVIEGLMRKRFIYTNAAGWEAVKDLLIQALL